ncbi:hypothetical protein Bca101_019185 [Brassica carinata]
MSSEMDKAMLALSLKDNDDVPFDMPNLPHFFSTDRNSNSLIGRLLNPPHQKMASLILDMPRKWQKQNRVRGIALSDERFQFIFDHAFDLEDVLEKGMQTYNEWGLAIDRWYENPPPDYLQYVPIWVQIKNIPVNHYTEAAITAIGELIGHVDTVAFDPTKSQRHDFVRVKIILHVSKPLSKFRIINLPGGIQHTVYFYYEKAQKRCYLCQRLTHANDQCPFVNKDKPSSGDRPSLNSSSTSSQSRETLSENDPLFGVLQENQVGIHPISGRPRIAPEVLQEMRNYLLSSNGEDRSIKEQRIISSVKEAEKNPITQKTVLQLMPPPIITNDLNKGKGIVFGYNIEPLQQVSSFKDQAPKLMSAAISAGRSLPNHSQEHGKGRKRPGKFKRNAQLKKQDGNSQSDTQASKDQLSLKRKAEDEVDDAPKASKPKASVMVPNEGPSNV